MFRSIAFTLIQKAVAYFDSVLFGILLLRIVIVYFILFVFFFNTNISIEILYEYTRKLTFLHHQIVYLA